MKEGKNKNNAENYVRCQCRNIEQQTGYAFFFFCLFHLSLLAEVMGMDLIPSHGLMERRDETSKSFRKLTFFPEVQDDANFPSSPCFSACRSEG